MWVAAAAHSPKADAACRSMLRHTVKMLEQCCSMSFQQQQQQRWQWQRPAVLL
jgi:hypothetical protein